VDKTDKSLSLKLIAIKRILVNKGAYFDGEIRRFSLNDNKFQLAKQPGKDNFKPLIMIVSRKYYQEKQSTFPIDDKAELNKLLKIQFSSQGRTSYCINDIKNGKSYVNSWSFNYNVPDSVIILPESLLFALTIPDKQVLNIKKVNEEELFVVRSQESTFSLVLNSNINTIQKFSLAVGVSQNGNAKPIKTGEFAEGLAEGCNHLTLSLLTRFLSSVKSENNTKLITSIIIPVVSIFTGYLLLSSTYLVYEKGRLEAVLNSQNQEVTAALDIQQQYDTNVVYRNEVSQVFNLKQQKTPIWLVLDTAFGIANFTNIKLDNNQYILRGKANSSVELLELLSNHPYVKKAIFDSPSLVTKNQELFVISITLFSAINRNVQKPEINMAVTQPLTLEQEKQPVGTNRDLNNG